MRFLERVRRKGVYTHEEVPEQLGAMLVALLRTAPVTDASPKAKEIYPSLSGYQLDAELLRFKEPAGLGHAFVEVNAPVGANWQSFGAVVVVSPAAVAGSTDVAKRVDLYSVYPGGSKKGDIYVGDAYLRLDLGSDGRVLTADLNGVTDAQSESARSSYGTMLFFVALVLAGTEVTEQKPAS